MRGSILRNPLVADPARTSISQQWYAAGSGTTTQTVEGGWQVAEKHYSTKNAALFIYWTADNYDKTGCYNIECSGFAANQQPLVSGGNLVSVQQAGGNPVGLRDAVEVLQRELVALPEGTGEL